MEKTSNARAEIRLIIGLIGCLDIGRSWPVPSTREELIEKFGVEELGLDGLADRNPDFKSILDRALAENKTLIDEDRKRNEMTQRARVAREKRGP